MFSPCLFVARETGIRGRTRGSEKREREKEREREREREKKKRRELSPLSYCGFNKEPLGKVPSLLSSPKNRLKVTGRDWNGKKRISFFEVISAASLSRTSSGEELSSERVETLEDSVG